jgi:ABC-type transport system substrate-binding protein
MPAGLDPAKNSDPNEIQIYSQIYETLVKLDDHSNVVPGLASSWERSSDHKVFVFHLKRHIRFQDGAALNAASIVHSFNRQLSINHDSPLLKLVSRVEAIDDSTIKICLSKSYSLFLHNLSSPYGLVAISSSALEKYRDDIAFHPVGTGPYLLSEWNDSKIELNYFKDYRENNNKVQRIIFKYYPSQKQLLDDLNSDKLDLLFPVAGYQIDRLRWLGKIDYLVRPPTITNYLGFNNQKYPFFDEKIRNAFLLAIDVRKLTYTLNRGNAIPANGPLPPGFLTEQDTKQETFNLKKAKELLAKTNFYKNPVIKLFFPEPAFARHTIVEFLKADLSRLGVSLKVTYFKTWSEHNQACKSDSSQLFLNSWESDIPGNPENFLQALFYSTSPNNVLNYKNLQVDAWLDEAAITPSEEERQILYQKIVRVIIGDAPAVFLYYVKPHFAYNKLKIKQLAVSPYNIIQFHKVTLYD